MISLWEARQCNIVIVYSEGACEMKQRNKKSVTIADIAKKTGVCRATVSRVLNHSHLVAPRTAEKIRQAIYEMGYCPDPIARALVSRSSRLVALIIPNMLCTSFVEIICGCDDALQAQGYGLVIAHSNENYAREISICRTLKSKIVDGVIFAGSAGLQPPSWEISPSTPIVNIECPVNHEGVRATINGDTENGMTEALRYLVKLGHLRIGFIQGRRSTATAEMRLAAFMKALDRCGLQISLEYIVDGGWTPQGGCEATKTLLNMRNRPTAILASSEPMAIGAIAAIRDQGLNIPDDISLVSFFDSPISAYTNPPLTTISFPAYEMGRTAAEVMMKSLSEPNRKVENIIFPLKLVVRSSTGPAPHQTQV